MVHLFKFTFFLDYDCQIALHTHRYMLIYIWKNANDAVITNQLVMLNILQIAITKCVCRVSYISVLSHSSSSFWFPFSLRDRPAHIATPFCCAHCIILSFLLWLLLLFSRAEKKISVHSMGMVIWSSPTPNRACTLHRCICSKETH